MSSALAARQFSHQAWTTEDGLPQNTVHQVLQTRDGYLWIATEGGLARFDGLSFSVFRHEEDPAFLSDDIACLAEDSHGVLWVGTTDGLLRYARGRFARVPLAEAAADASVLDLAPDDSGGMLAMTTQGLTRIAEGREQAIPAPVTAIASAPDHTVWMAAGSRLLQYTHGRFADAGELPPSGTVLAMQISEDSVVRVKTSTGMFVGAAAKRGAWTPLVLPPSQLANAFFEDQANRTWIGTRHGLYVSEDRSTFSPVAAIGDHAVLSISQDHEGDIWVGTESDGLVLLRPQRFAQVPGLDGTPVAALTQTTDGAIWIGTRDAGLRVLSPGKIAALPKLSSPLESEFVLALTAGNHGDVWVGTLEGLAHVDHGAVVRFSSADGLPDDVIRSLLLDEDGSLWIGTRRGLVHWKGGRGDPFVHVDGLPSELIGAMLRSRTISPQGTRPLWVATRSGLSRIDGGVRDAASIHTFGIASGGDDGIITSLAETPDGTLWIGTQRLGLALLTSSGVQAIPQAGLPQNINSLLADERGDLWIGASRGIFRVASGELKQCLSESACAPAVARFGYADGMPNEQTSSGGHPASLLARDGSFWFATTRGVATLDLAAARERTAAPPVVIERFLVDNVDKLPAASSIKLPYGHGSLTFDYAALSFAGPSRIHYRYLLAGFDKQWTDAGQRRTAYYTNLPPGQYSFRVQAANNDGIWNRSGATLSFTILPPFYRRLWFYLLVLLVIASATYVIYYLRVRRLRSEFDAVLAERSRLAREIHDTLAQNFVGISIQLQIAEQLLRANDTAGTGEQLLQTRALVQEGLNDARQSIWELRASVAQDSLPTRIAKVVERASTSGAKEQLKIGGIYRPLDPALEKEVLRITQEALANVRRHAHATEVTVDLRYEADRLHLAVVDNGRGFDPEAIDSTKDHFGVQGMRERAAELSATLLVKSSPGDGTAVTLVVPLPRTERRNS